MGSEPGSRLPSDTASFDQGLVRLLTAHVSAILWTTDPSLRITWISGGGLAAFGLKPGDGVGRTLFEYFGTEDPRYPPIAAHLAALEGRSGDYEVVYRGRAFYSRVEPIRGEDGAITGVIGLGLDITETARARDELRESEERFRAVFERSPVGIGIAVQGMLRYVNPALLGLFHVEKPSDLVGKSVLDHIAPRCREEVRRRIEGRERGEPWKNSFETVGLRPDGTEFDYHLDVARIRLPDAEATLAFITDVTERKRAQEDLERRVRERTAELARTNLDLRKEVDERKRSQEALSRSEEKFRDLAENIREVFWLVDAGTREILYISPGYAEIWGRSCESLVRSPSSWQEAVHPEDRDQVVGAQASQKDGRYDQEYRILLPDGRVRWVRDRAFPVKGPDGKVHRLAGVAEDITDRKRLEAELREAIGRAQRAYQDLQEAQSRLVRSEKLASIGMLVAGVAHEINNPLNVISGNLKLLKDGVLSKAVRKKRERPRGRSASAAGELRQARAMVRDALRAAQRAEDIIRTFRDFARDTRLAEAADLNGCLRRAAALVRRQFPPGVALVRDLDPLPKVRYVPGQMTQVFLNLMQNAAEAIDGKGKIILRSKREGPYVLVEVEDTGKGMSPELKDRIFEPFFTTKEVGRGLGLGLALSAMIVQNHGGEIRVESTPGRGSVFQVRLPLSALP